MSSVKRGLGRGLDALFENNNSPQESVITADVSSVQISLLVTNPNQPRKYFDKETLQELADSIASQGIIQPLLVRPLQNGQNYEIIAGERRYRAAQLANLEEIPVFIRNMTDIEVMAASLIENVQREDLNPIEQALALKRLRDEFMITQEDLSQKIGKSRSTIANSLRLLNLSAQSQESLISGKISVGHARALLSIDDINVQEVLLMAIINQELTVRDAENAVKDWKNGQPFFWENKAADAVDITADSEVDNSLKPDVHRAADTEANNDLNSDVNGIADAEIDNNLNSDVDSVADSEADNNLKEVNAKNKASSNRVKTENIKNLQKHLNEQLHFRANISGTEEKGRITLSYQNAEEFDSLLQKLGIQQ